MNQHQFDAFMIRSRDLWETMETYRLAYLDESDRSTKRAEKLKYLTLGMGIATGIVSGAVFMDVDTSEYIVGVLGTFTGTLAVADKLFGWEQRSTETWERYQSLENLQKDLFHYALDINSGTDAESAGLFLQQLRDKSVDDTRLRITDLDEWKSRANEALLKHRINQISFDEALPGGPVPAPAPEPDEFILEDTADIVAVARGGA
ncbi:MAG: hypothetical protein ABJ308_07225 [Halieaceae bacterium]